MIFSTTTIRTIHTLVFRGVSNVVHTPRPLEPKFFRVTQNQLLRKKAHQSLGSNLRGLYMYTMYGCKNIMSSMSERSRFEAAQRKNGAIGEK